MSLRAVSWASIENAGWERAYGLPSTETDFSQPRLAENCKSPESEIVRRDAAEGEWH